MSAQPQNQESNEPRTIEEAYMQAVQASRLKMEAHKVSDIDIIAASGMIGATVGSAFTRLAGEWATCRSLIGPRCHSVTLSNQIMIANNLRSLRVSLAAVEGFMRSRNILDIERKASLIVFALIQKQCIVCDGTGYGGHGRGTVCKACRGSREQAIPFGEDGRAVASYMEACVGRANQLRKRALGK